MLFKNLRGKMIARSLRARDFRFERLTVHKRDVGYIYVICREGDESKVFFVKRHRWVGAYRVYKFEGVFGLGGRFIWINSTTFNHELGSKKAAHLRAA